MGKCHIVIGSISWFLPLEIKTSKHYAVTTEGSLSAMLLPFSPFPLPEVQTQNTSRTGSGLNYSVHSQIQWSAFIMQDWDDHSSIHEPLKKMLFFFHFLSYNTLYKTWLSEFKFRLRKEKEILCHNHMFIMSCFIIEMVGLRRTDLINIQNQDSNSNFCLFIHSKKLCHCSSKKIGSCCLFEITQQSNPKCLLPSQPEGKCSCIYTAL